MDHHHTPLVRSDDGWKTAYPLLPAVGRVRRIEIAVLSHRSHRHHTGRKRAAAAQLQINLSPAMPRIRQGQCET
jgi:hypothetical protein